VPLAPDVMVIQLTLLTAVQLHAPDTVTFTVPVPPLLLNDLRVGDIENEQLPAWFTVKVWPAMLSVPVREPFVKFSLTA
jgi:hypothetical protein